VLARRWFFGPLILANFSHLAVVTRATPEIAALAIDVDPFGRTPRRRGL
jgi:hypothetical protein